MAVFDIPLAAPTVPDGAAKQVRERVSEGVWSTGTVARTFEERLADFLGRQRAAVVNSGGTAVELGARVSDIPAGGTVLVPSYVCPSVPSALRHADVRVRYVDTDRTLHTDPDAVAEHAADADGVILTHCFGRPGELPALVEIARDHDLDIIEDVSQALGARSHGEPVGQVGDVVVGSCGATKPLSCAEGGFVAGPPEPTAVVRHLRDSGGGISDARSVSGRLSDIHATIGLAQLDSYGTRLAHRQFISNRYDHALPDDAPLATIDQTTSAYHAYPITLDNRDTVAEDLAADGVETTRLYDARGLGRDCPTAHGLGRKILCLPIHHDITQADVKRIGAHLA